MKEIKAYNRKESADVVVHNHELAEVNGMTALNAIMVDEIKSDERSN